MGTYPERLFAGAAVFPMSSVLCQNAPPLLQDPGNALPSTPNMTRAVVLSKAGINHSSSFHLGEKNRPIGPL